MRLLEVTLQSVDLVLQLNQLHFVLYFGLVGFVSLCCDLFELLGKLRAQVFLLLRKLLLELVLLSAIEFVKLVAVG